MGTHDEGEMKCNNTKRNDEGGRYDEPPVSTKRRKLVSNPYARQCPAGQTCHRDSARPTEHSGDRIGGVAPAGTSGPVPPNPRFESDSAVRVGYQSCSARQNRGVTTLCCGEGVSASCSAAPAPAPKPGGSHAPRGVSLKRPFQAAVSEIPYYMRPAERSYGPRNPYAASTSTAATRGVAGAGQNSARVDDGVSGSSLVTTGNRSNPRNPYGSRPRSVTYTCRIKMAEIANPATSHHSRQYPTSSEAAQPNTIIAAKQKSGNSLSCMKISSIKNLSDPWDTKPTDMSAPNRISGDRAKEDVASFNSLREKSRSETANEGTYSSRGRSGCQSSDIYDIGIDWDSAMEYIDVPRVPPPSTVGPFRRVQKEGERKMSLDIQFHSEKWLRSSRQCNSGIVIKDNNSSINRDTPVESVAAQYTIPLPTASTEAKGNGSRSDIQLPCAMMTRFDQIEVDQRGRLGEARSIITHFEKEVKKRINDLGAVDTKAAKREDGGGIRSTQPPSTANIDSSGSGHYACILPSRGLTARCDTFEDLRIEGMGEFGNIRQYSERAVKRNHILGPVGTGISNGPVSVEDTVGPHKKGDSVTATGGTDFTNEPEKVVIRTDWDPLAETNACQVPSSVETNAMHNNAISSHQCYAINNSRNINFPSIKSQIKLCNSGQTEKTSPPIYDVSDPRALVGKKKLQNGIKSDNNIACNMIIDAEASPESPHTLMEATVGSATPSKVTQDSRNIKQLRDRKSEEDCKLERPIHWTSPQALSNTTTNDDVQTPGMKKEKADREASKGRDLIMPFSSAEKVPPTLPSLPPDLLYPAQRVATVQDKYRLELIKNASISETLLNGWNLHPHQKSGVLRGIKMRKLVLAFDMGLGKTVSADIEH